MKTRQVEFCNEVLTVLEETDLGMFKAIEDEDEKEEYRRFGRSTSREVQSIFHPLTQDAMLKKALFVE